MNGGIRMEKLLAVIVVVAIALWDSFITVLVPLMAMYAVGWHELFWSFIIWLVIKWIIKVVAEQ